MNPNQWEKIKDTLKKAHPLARLRRLHAVINTQGVSKKVVDEAKELFKKARVELDFEQPWKWGGEITFASRQTPALEERTEEPRTRRSLEETVEKAAPNKPKGEEAAQNVYSSGADDTYFGKSYSAKKQYTPEQELSQKTVDATATASEIAAGEAKYHRKKS